VACRRRDTPALLKALQNDMLALLSQAKDLAGCRALSGRLQEVAQEYRARLLESRVTAAELAIASSLSKSPEDYVHDTASTLAAKQLAAGGVALHPGETVRYIITSARDKVKEWRSRPLALSEGALEYDAGKYLELLERAAAEILDGL
jgi:DNA polymerase elongation subunit (family B)